MRDWKIIIPFTKIYRYFKKKPKPTAKEIVKEAIDDYNKRIYQTKCCGHIFLGFQHPRQPDNTCSECGKSWRGVKQIGTVKTT